MSEQQAAAIALGEIRKIKEEGRDSWLKNEPRALLETSAAWVPLVEAEPMLFSGAMIPVWKNDRYQVTVRRHEVDPVFGSRGGLIQLGISAIDGTARHDFRDFQQIKNELAGPESEAFELYPAESRLMDPSNYYTLWCFPSCRIKVGQTKSRCVLLQREAFAPQRAFPEER